MVEPVVGMTNDLDGLETTEEWLTKVDVEEIGVSSLELAEELTIEVPLLGYKGVIIG